MQKLNFQRRAAARCAERVLDVPPEGFRGPSRGLMMRAHRVCLETIS